MMDKAKTYDIGKEPLAWMPWAAIDCMSKVQLYGHGKYKDFNNYRKGMEVSRNLSCVIRHVRDYMNGANVDHESGEHPLGHAMCRLAFVLQNIADGTAIDDRYKKEQPTHDRKQKAQSSRPASARPQPGAKRHQKRKTVRAQRKATGRGKARGY